MSRRILFTILVFWAAPLWAQQPDTADVPTGVRLGLIYETEYRPTLAVRTIAGTDAVAAEIRRILRRDLNYSDHFEMADVPAALGVGRVDYGAWNDLGVVYLVTGEVQPAPSGYRLRLALHDVVYGEVQQVGSFRLPYVAEPGFRMAVHAVSDEIVRWATGTPGMAASRIAFVRERAGGGYALMVVDSDGENLRRIATTREKILLSPAWSPDGEHIAYALGGGDGWEIRARELGSGDVRVLFSGPGLNITPAYAPEGRRLAFARSTGSGTQIQVLNLTGECCLERLSHSPRDDLSPTYSPDGERIAFTSNRLGQPNIYVMPTDGGEATLLTPYIYGEPGYYTSPDWSPTGSMIAFHGRSGGTFQIMVADADRPGEPVRQLTSEGTSEDPSWAPDGRHIVFSGTRDGRHGLYVLDTVTGRVRLLVEVRQALVPAWSPRLLRAAELTGSGS